MKNFMHRISEKSWPTADFASTYSDDETEEKAKMSRWGKLLVCC